MIAPPVQLHCSPLGYSPVLVPMVFATVARTTLMSHSPSGHLPSLASSILALTSLTATLPLGCRPTLLTFARSLPAFSLLNRYFAFGLSALLSYADLNRTYTRCTNLGRLPSGCFPTPTSLNRAGLGCYGLVLTALYSGRPCLLTQLINLWWAVMSKQAQEEVNTNEFLSRMWQ